MTNQILTFQKFGNILLFFLFILLPFIRFLFIQILFSHIFANLILDDAICFTNCIKLLAFLTSCYPDLFYQLYSSVHELWLWLYWFFVPTWYFSFQNGLQCNTETIVCIYFIWFFVDILRWGVFCIHLFAQIHNIFITLIYIALLIKLLICVLYVILEQIMWNRIFFLFYGLYMVTSSQKHIHQTYRLRIYTTDAAIPVILHFSLPPIIR